MPAPLNRFRRWIAALATLLLPGCATFRGYRGPEERVLPRDPTRPTALDSRLHREAAGRDAGTSGVAMLAGGEDALVARLALADLAGRSIDIQTYIWDLDTAGRLAMARLLAAADRGVRIRLLLDDTTTIGGERSFAALDQHPNVEVRFFNPFRTRSGGTWAERSLEFLFDFGRLNRRMHNKVWIADDAFAIVGGRNIADEYYLMSEQRDFRDLDLLVAGPAAESASAVFDRFWNSRWAVPAQHLTPPRKGRLESLRRRLAEFAAHQKRFPYPDAPATGEAERALDESVPTLDWAPVEVLADEPEKIESAGRSEIADRLVEETDRVRESLRIEVAYLSLPAAAIDRLGALVGRGVSVRILTNSLATTDVLAAHAGYEATRRRLLEAGVELHELRPGGHAPAKRLLPPVKSRASLHSKAVVFDDDRVFVGSLNLDPRSLRLNTEIGLWVHDTRLAERVAAWIDSGCSFERSWRLELRPRRVRANGRWVTVSQLIWVGRRSDGTEEIRTHEPRATIWRRALAHLLSWLPIEGLI
jgi:putative cardiolipin synthase